MWLRCELRRDAAEHCNFFVRDSRRSHRCRSQADDSRYLQKAQPVLRPNFDEEIAGKERQVNLGVNTVVPRVATAMQRQKYFRGMRRQARGDGLLVARPSMDCIPVLNLKRIVHD